ncbi:hypothetical protein YBT020_02150 [Bacillus thuringiensis serovar finitimus YBT-020]|nr:hypothetical protein YBT020_02150 [Bacillus thuringiensis serovar finitimus YBT-020]
MFNEEKAKGDVTADISFFSGVAIIVQTSQQNLRPLSPFHTRDNHPKAKPAVQQHHSSEHS